MENINIFIKRNINLILGIFVLLQPIIDLLTGISIKFDIFFSSGIIIRVLFMLFTLYYLIFVSKSLYRKKSIFILLSIFAYIIIFSIIHLSYFEFSNLIRTFYFPIMFISIFNISDENKILDNKYLLISLFIYVSIIFIADITNTAFNSYEIAKTGHVGWFNSANEIGAIIGILLPILFESIYKRFNIAKILLLFLTIFVTFKVGTRIPLISIFICLVVYYIKYMIFFFKNNYKKTFILGIFTLIIATSFTFILIPKTPIYKNIIIHTNYLKIDSVDDIFRDAKTIDHFIFSERLSFLNNTNKLYANSNIIQKLVGIGYKSNEKMIEMDMFDIFYRHGIIGFIIYFGSIASLIITNKNKKFNINYLLPFLLTLFISFFAGHVFIAPAVSIFVIILLLKLFLERTNNKKSLLFCSYDLNMGGIETSLINLLKNIDYNKYNVTLMLEKNQGILIDKLPKEVKVFQYKVSENKNVFIRKIINLIKKIIYIIFKYKTYDFSCCYATYSLPCNMIARLSSNNSILYIHSNYYMAFNKDINKVNQFFNIRHLNNFRKIIFVSNEAKDDLCNIYKDIAHKSIVINNFVDSKSIIELSNEKIDMEKPKNKTLFVFVGRLDESSKKVSRMIKMFKILKEKKKNIELWIIGDGKDYKIIDNLIKEYKLSKYIKLVGEKINPYPYISNADYIILTSDYEGFPVIYNEAIILNKKIITTINVSDDYIVIPNNFGYIVSKDEKEMSEQINEILNNDNLKMKNLDFNEINKNRIKKLEKIFEGVV